MTTTLHQRSLPDRIVMAARRWTKEKQDAVAAIMPPVEGFAQALSEAMSTIFEELGGAATEFLAEIYSFASISERVWPPREGRASTTVKTGLVFVPITGLTGAMRKSLRDQAARDAITQAFLTALPAYGIGVADLAMLPGSIGLIQLIVTPPETLYAAVRDLEPVGSPDTPENPVTLPDAAARAAAMRRFGETQRLAGDPATVQTRCLVFVIVQTGWTDDTEAVKTVDDSWLDQAEKHVPLLKLSPPSDPYDAIRRMATDLVRYSLRLEAAQRQIWTTPLPKRYHLHWHDKGLDATLECGSDLVGPTCLPSEYVALIVNTLASDLAEDDILVIEHEESFDRVQSRRGRLS